MVREKDTAGRNIFLCSLVMTELSSQCKTTEDSCSARQHHDHDHHIHDDYVCSYIELTPSLVSALRQAGELCIFPQAALTLLVSLQWVGAMSRERLA